MITYEKCWVSHSRNSMFCLINFWAANILKKFCICWFVCRLLRDDRKMRVMECQMCVCVWRKNTIVIFGLIHPNWWSLKKKISTFCCDYPGKISEICCSNKRLLISKENDNDPWGSSRVEQLETIFSSPGAWTDTNSISLTPGPGPIRSERQTLRNCMDGNFICVSRGKKYRRTWSFRLDCNDVCSVIE